MLLILIFFQVEHIPEEIKAFISNKNIKTNIFSIFVSDLLILSLQEELYLTLQVFFHQITFFKKRMI